MSLFYRAKLTRFQCKQKNMSPREEMQYLEILKADMSFYWPTTAPVKSLDWLLKAGPILMKPNEHLKCGSTLLAANYTKIRFSGSKKNCCHSNILNSFDNKSGTGRNIIVLALQIHLIWSKMLSGVCMTTWSLRLPQSQTSSQPLYKLSGRLLCQQLLNSYFTLSQDCSDEEDFYRRISWHSFMLKKLSK